MTTLLSKKQYDDIIKRYGENKSLFQANPIVSPNGDVVPPTFNITISENGDAECSGFLEDVCGNKAIINVIKIPQKNR